MEIVNVKKSGAAGDGIHDDFHFLQAALGTGSRQVFIPAGKYRISGTLKVSSDTEIIADSCAEIFVCEKQPKKRGDFLLTNSDHVNGNSNISVRGGIWNGNYDGKNNSKNQNIFDVTACSGAILNFFNVRNLKLEDIILENSVTYFTRFGKLDGFRFRNISFRSDTVTLNQDGLHFSGGCRNGTVENVRALTDGETGDDLLAFNADDCITRLENFDTCCGDIENITVRNVSAENCHTAIRLSSVFSAIRNITVENIRAGCRAYAVNMDATRYCRTPLFRDADYPKGVGNIENVTIRNMEMWSSDSSDERRKCVLICAETLCDGFRIENLRRNTEKDKSPLIPTIGAGNITDVNIIYTFDGRQEKLSLNLKNEALELLQTPPDFAMYRK